MWVRVLGTSQVVLDEPAPSAALDARKPRSVLAALALRLGSDVPPDALVRLVWGEDSPRGAHGTLHSYLSGVRRVLEPGLGPREKPQILLTGDHGYRLALARDEVDAHHFADEVRTRHRLLSPLASQLTTGPAPDWPTREEISQHVDRLEELLGLWTGEAYADLPDEPEVVLERTSLDQLRLNAEEARVLGLLALGDHAVVVAATEQATTRHPLQERVWALHALALARSGRQAEALAALRQIRAVLADELGLDPGQELRDLEQAVLVQDPALQHWLRPSVDTLEPSPAAGSSPPAPPDGAMLDWETVGRASEVAALMTVLDRAQSGTPATALLVGEPGIGKSRLVERVSEAAAERGFVVATGRCSQDDGAPPLWPWSQALRAAAGQDGRPLDEGVDRLVAGEAVGGVEQGADRTAFQAWESVVHEVTSRTMTTPLLIVLEDLHWADTSSLKVLRHLVSTAAPGHHLAVLVSRRPWPEPAGALAEVGEELARRHVTRLDLAGLSLEEAGGLVEAVAGTTIPAGVVEDWHARSGGNPYFLVELARLGVTAPDADPRLPATVRDVILRRLEGLPEETRAMLLLAAVLGRRCSLDLLAAVAEQPVEEVDNALAPALAAGLVQEPEAGTLAFTHALTRDAVATTTSPSRLARLHARVAHALADDQAVAGLIGPEERVTELARHWLAAGPSHVSRAWRAASAAADQARRTFSWVEAEQLVSAAIAAHRRDPLGTATERIDLLLARARDCRPNAEWDQVLPCAEEAIALARREEDLPRLASAAAAAHDNVVWMSQQWNEVPEDTIENLRWALAQLPTRDSPDRCRVMLSLAMLLYYEPSAPAELKALVDEGVAMARRIGEPALLWWASHTAWKALWVPAYADLRLDLAHEGLKAARESGDLDSEAVAGIILTASLLELADRPAYERTLRDTGLLIARRRNSYAQMALTWLDLSMAALRGDDAEASRFVDQLYELRPRLNAGNEALHIAAIQMISGLWNGQIGELVEPMVQAIEVAQNDLANDFLVLALARSDDDVDLLREKLSGPLEHQVVNWGSDTTWCDYAEAASVAGDVGLAEQMAARLTPLAGRIGVSGISSVMGPIDGYLALALATTGRTADAAEAAGRADAQAEEWGFTAYSAWLDEHRRRLGF